MKRMTLTIYNYAAGGYAFALEEETGKTVFLPKQLCDAHEIDETDVGRVITSIVGESGKGLQANTVTFIDEDDEELNNEIALMRAEIDDLKARLDILDGTDG